MVTTTAKAKLPPPGFEGKHKVHDSVEFDGECETKGPSGVPKSTSSGKRDAAPELASQKDANLVFDSENTAHFDKVCAGFRKMHSHPINIVGHFVTTPLCL